MSTYLVLEMEDGEGWKEVGKVPETMEELVALIADYDGMPNPIRIRRYVPTQEVADRIIQGWEDDGGA